MVFNLYREHFLWTSPQVHNVACERCFRYLNISYIALVHYSFLLLTLIERHIHVFYGHTHKQRSITKKCGGDLTNWNCM